VSTITLIDHFVEPGKEWMVESYPGSGAYKTDGGIAFVMGGMVWIFNSTGWQTILDGPRPVAIDVHRMLDQMITLTKPVTSNDGTSK
jgi:hypothetical protein